ncbi:GNAT family N-acetyltransferase [Curtobacterium sp. 22159]|uniref:GNAT family N-acetyltransferase n=1 Tax=Curtobacterium sp. 22159 TaxID=3453882 RepID=UPI003F85FE2A
MDRDDAPSAPVTLLTPRLRLRPRRAGDAGLHRTLWTERDPRVPAHRRIGSDGRPTVADLEDQIRRDDTTPAPGLLVVERRDTAAALGYCGLVANSADPTGAPELAYEFLRATWGHGYATEAASAVVELARAVAHPLLVATVRAWNTPSLRVLAKLGFVDTGERERDDVHGDSLRWQKAL